MRCGLPRAPWVAYPLAMRTGASGARSPDPRRGRRVGASWTLSAGSCSFCAGRQEQGGAGKPRGADHRRTLLCHAPIAVSAKALCAMLLLLATPIGIGNASVAARAI